MVIPSQSENPLWHTDTGGQANSTQIRLSNILTGQLRLEASAYSIEARHARDELSRSGLPLVPLFGEQGICNEAHNAFRFKRIYVDEEHGIPFLSSSDIISYRPSRDRYISRKLTRKLDRLIVRPWDVLISCSGTVGNVAMAGQSIAGAALSQHAIRLRASNALTSGYVTAFLRSPFGRLQLRKASYGSVVTHIEPAHLKEIIVPVSHPILRSEIGRLMCKAVELRDEANRKLDEADSLLHQTLGLQRLSDLLTQSRGKCDSQIRASALSNRLDASYHSRSVQSAIDQLKALSFEVTNLGDERVADVRAVTKFRKRVYVEQGIPLLSSKQIFQIDPVDVKFLARGAHRLDLEEISLVPNTVLVTCSGTIGRCQIVPAYMQGWASSQDSLRVVARSNMNPGYLYAWLSSTTGASLVRRYAYGSVILHIDQAMLSAIPIPLPPSHVQDEVGDLVLQANSLRNEAWQTERHAIAQMVRLIHGSYSPSSFDMKAVAEEDTDR